MNKIIDFPVSNEHQDARNLLDHIFESGNKKTIEAILQTLRQFAKLVDLAPGQEIAEKNQKAKTCARLSLVKKQLA